MNYSTYEIKLDIQNYGVQNRISLKKGDSARELRMFLFDGGKAYYPSEKATIVFRAKKPDGSVVFDNCTAVKNEVSYKIPSGVTEIPGILKCELAIYSADRKKLTTPRFEISVCDTVYSDEEVEASSSFTALDELVKETQELIESGKLGGFSPEVSFDATDDGYRLSITDITGTKTADITVPKVSVSKSNGTATISVTDKNGTRSVSVSDGKDGEGGEGTSVEISQEAGDSATSVMSQRAVTDYVKNQMSNIMPEIVSSVEEMTDTSKKYVLKESNTIYVSGLVEAPAPNRFNPANASLNMRLSSSGSTSALKGFFVTDFIPVSFSPSGTDTITIINPSNSDSYPYENGSYQKIQYYDAQKNNLGAAVLGSVEASNHVTVTISNGEATFKAGEKFGAIDAKLLSASYIRICLCASDNISAESTSEITADILSDVSITLSYEAISEEGWYDTGIMWSADGSGQIADLNAAVEENSTEILKAKSRIAVLEGDASASIPSYFTTEINRAVGEIKKAQNSAGANAVSFVWCSDMHIHDANDNYSRNIGALAAALMKKCDIPFMINCGDLLTNTSLDKESSVMSCYDRAWEILSPVGGERLLMTAGNHDGAWSSKTVDGVTSYYTSNLHPDTLWQCLYRPQSVDFRRIWGDDGKYFYLDNIPQKTRFICLNSHDGKYIENEDGSVVWSTMKSGYSQAQLEFFARALDVDSGWSIIISSHVPPTAQLPTDYSATRCFNLIRGIANAYSQRTMFSGIYTHNDLRGEGDWADSQISVDFSCAEGTILGWFCGHAHIDSITDDDLPFPIVTITSAGNFSYDDAEEARILGTSNETALDVVTVDRKNGKINFTRVGVGNDRIIE